MCPQFVIVLLLFSLPLRAAESAENKELQQRIAEEVQRRRALREEVAKAAEVDAQRLLREHESGKSTATEAQLAAARKVIREADERRAKPPASNVAGKAQSTVRNLTEQEQRERLQQVAAEVQRRRVQREEAEAAARGVVRDHESWAKPATEAQLAEARSLIRAADARLATKAPARSAGGEELVQLKLPGADMATVASMWRTLFGGEVTVGERVKSRVVTMEFPATPRSEVRSKLVAGLGDHGIAVIERADGVFLDSEPAPKPER